jgi:hypothetical protein
MTARSNGVAGFWMGSPMGSALWMLLPARGLAVAVRISRRPANANLSRAPGPVGPTAQSIGELSRGGPGEWLARAAVTMLGNGDPEAWGEAIGVGLEAKRKFASPTFAESVHTLPNQLAAPLRGQRCAGGDGRRIGTARLRVADMLLLAEE